MPNAAAQGSAAIAVDPNSGPPTPAANVAQPCPPNAARPAWCFNITFTQFHQCPSGQTNCIIVDFLQGGAAPLRIGTADPRGSSSFSGTLAVPPTATGGPAQIHAHSSTDDAPLVGFTVTAAPPPATTTTVPGTTTSSSTSSSTTSSSTTTLTTVVPPLTEPPTTVVPTKSSSSHSDVPRYIAVALVVLAAAATAAVDTRQRRLRELPPP